MLFSGAENEGANLIENGIRRGRVRIQKQANDTDENVTT